jgi:hypothetical protein
VQGSLLPRINILLSTLYLLQDQKLIYGNYFEQGINMISFCIGYVTWHDYVYKAWHFYLLYIFVIKYSKIWFITIFYKELILKTGFGQTYGKDLVKRILRKFILYFYDIYFIFYEV